MFGIVGGSPTLANLGNDHGFIGKKYISIGMRPFGEIKNNVMRAYAQSGQISYHFGGSWFLTYYALFRSFKPKPSS